MKKLLLAFAVFLIFPAAGFTRANLGGKFSITLTLSGEGTSKLTDGKVESYVSLPAGERIAVNCGGACALMLKWYETAAYEITEFSQGKKACNAIYDDSILNRYVPLNGADRLTVDLPLGGKLSDIIFFESSAAYDTQVWEAPYKKADILVIAAHPDDECLYMGGTIPYYCGERGLNVVVAWMSHQRRLRQDEALAALWTMGVRHYPEFVGFPDRWSETYADGAKNWGEEAILGAIVNLYRKYRPEAVVTHDLKGEYGHGAHMVTAAMALKAAEAAAIETQFPESANAYGTWQIKKLYLHLYKENEIIMDWNMPLDSFGGKTALDMAKASFSCHRSQRKRGYYVSDTFKYSCAKFGLAFTAAGPDTGKNDFLENIPPQCLSDYIAPEPEPAALHAREPVLMVSQPSAEPLREPSKELQAAESPVAPLVTADNGVTAMAAALFVIIIFDICIRLKRKHPDKHKKK